MKTSGTYRNKLTNEWGDENCYIAVTKQRIEKRIKEPKEDIKKGRMITALAKVNAEEKIEIDFQILTMP